MILKENETKEKVEGTVICNGCGKGEKCLVF
jgi:hypothetical protein